LDLSCVEGQWEPIELNNFDGQADAEGWVTFNYDSGAGITAFPRAFNVPGTVAGSSTFRTASGQLVPDEGQVKLMSQDELGHDRAMKGRIADLHKCFVSASSCAKAGSSGWLTKDGGYLIPRKHPVHKQIEDLLKKAATKSNSTLLPLYLEKGVYNFYLKVSKAEAVNALVMKSEDEIGKMSADQLRSELKRQQQTFAGQLAGPTGS
jgi:hypothetical protein